jgi:hypothetical protein
MTEYIAYHGTNSDNLESIKKNGFQPSFSHNEWLGSGVYFFIEGAFCPITNARNWAISGAWDKKFGKYTYSNYTILMTIVGGDRVLDLRNEEDLKLFDELRTHILNRYEIEKSKFRLNMHPDTFLCNAIATSMKLDILIQNFYIKTKDQRIKRFHSRVPNCTVLCAKESAKIELEHIDIIETKGVPHE